MPTELKQDQGFEQIYKDNLKRLKSMAYRHTHNIQDAEELADDAFFVLVTKLRDNEDIKNPAAFLTTTMRNLLGNYFRASKRERELQALLVAEARKQPNGDTLPLSDCLPAQLTAAEREILILRFEKKMSYFEISQHLKVAETAFRVRFLRAKAHLKDILEK